MTIKINVYKKIPPKSIVLPLQLKVVILESTPVSMIHIRTSKPIEDEYLFHSPKHVNSCCNSG